MTRIATWLRDARTSQTHPDTGRPWTQDYFLERIKAETGWAPAYANYNKLEQGKSQPRPETLVRLQDFWARYGIAAPDLTPERPPLSLDERQVLAAEETARQAKRQADALEGILALLSGRTPLDQAAVAASLAAVQAGVPSQPRSTDPLPDRA